MFGIVILLSFCDFKFITENFKFLKSTTGKGAFDIFIASLFMIGSKSDNTINVLAVGMACLFLAFGIFFVAMGVCFPGKLDTGDLNSKDLAANARKSGTKLAYENKELLL